MEGCDKLVVGKVRPPSGRPTEHDRGWLTRIEETSEGKRRKRGGRARERAKGDRNQPIICVEWIPFGQILAPAHSHVNCAPPSASARPHLLSADALKRNRGSALNPRSPPRAYQHAYIPRQYVYSTFAHRLHSQGYTWVIFGAHVFVSHTRGRTSPWVLDLPPQTFLLDTHPP